MESTDVNYGLSLLRMDNPAFGCFLVWGSILSIKMLLMAMLTVYRRITTKTFANPEDAQANKVEQVTFGNPAVERVRGAHLNDLENILPFLIVCLFYVASNPNVLAACILIRIAVVSRIIHTAVYAFRPVPQPSRAIAFFITYGITMFMAFYVIVVNFKHV